MLQFATSVPTLDLPISHNVCRYLAQKSGLFLRLTVFQEVGNMYLATNEAIESMECENIDKKHSTQVFVSPT